MMNQEEFEPRTSMQGISSPMPMTRAQHLETNQRCTPEPFAVIGGLRLFETGMDRRAQVSEYRPRWVQSSIGWEVWQ